MLWNTKITKFHICALLVRSKQWHKAGSLKINLFVSNEWRAMNSSRILSDSSPAVRQHCVPQHRPPIDLHRIPTPWYAVLSDSHLSHYCSSSLQLSGQAMQQHLILCLRKSNRATYFGIFESKTIVVRKKDLLVTLRVYYM